MKSFFVLLLTVIAFQTIAQDYTAEPPERTEDNLIVATYNIKFLGNREHDLEKLAKVIACFDVCGIQEVKQTSELFKLLSEIESFTGTSWGLVYGFPTHRPGGNYMEAYAFFYRKDRVDLGNGLTSNIWDNYENYRNDPYVATFTSQNFDFTIFLIHTRWSDDGDGTRYEEVKYMPARVNYFKSHSPEQDVIVMGDFNYSQDEDIMEQFEENAGLLAVDPNAGTTYKQNCSAYNSPYDHIYISDGNTSEYISGSSKAFDVTTYIYGDNSADNMCTSRSELSDHIPVFAIFTTQQEDDD